MVVQQFEVPPFWINWTRKFLDLIYCSLLIVNLINWTTFQHAWNKAKKFCEKFLGHLLVFLIIFQSKLGDKPSVGNVLIWSCRYLRYCVSSNMDVGGCNLKQDIRTKGRNKVWLNFMKRCMGVSGIIFWIFIEPFLIIKANYTLSTIIQQWNLMFNKMLWFYLSVTLTE